MEIGGKTMSEVIVITSGKGGVGKTTATANIGMGLARMKKRTVVIDTDIGLRNLDVVCLLYTSGTAGNAIQNVTKGSSQD